MSVVPLIFDGIAWNSVHGIVITVLLWNYVSVESLGISERGLITLNGIVTFPVVEFVFWISHHRPFHSIFHRNRLFYSCLFVEVQLRIDCSMSSSSICSGHRYQKQRPSLVYQKPLQFSWSSIALKNLSMLLASLNNRKVFWKLMRLKF